MNSNDLTSGAILYKFSSTSVVQEIAAVLLCCEATEMFCGRRKLHLTFHQHEGEQIMTEVNFWVNHYFKVNSHNLL